MRKQLPLLLTGLAALWFVCCYYVFALNSRNMLNVSDRWFNIATAFMTLVGAINLTRIHGTNIQRRKSGYFNSIALLIALWGYIVLGVWKQNTSVTYRWIYNSTVVPWEATMFSIIDRKSVV